VIRVFAGIVFLVAACGGDDGSADADASPDTGVVVPDAGPPAVAEPAPPVFTPCPTGWRVESGSDGIEICEPFAGDSPADCAPYDVDLPGAGGCARLDTCPAGDFAEDLPTDGRVIYVRPGPPGGDGSATSPFSTVGEALLGVGAGDVIALAKGRYDTLVRLPAGVTLHGACSAETILTTTIMVGAMGLVDVQGPGSALRRLTIEDVARVGISVNTEGTLEIENVYVRDVGMVGLYVLGGSVTADGFAIEDIRPSSAGTVGRGMDLDGGAVFEGSRISVRRTHDVAVRARDSQITLADFVVDETASDVASGATGVGMEASEGAAISLERGYVGRSRLGGIFVQSSSLSARMLVLRDVLGRESDGALGTGILATRGSSVGLSALLLERARTVGLAAEAAPAMLTLEDAVIRDIEPNPDGALGWGIDVTMGAVAELSRAHIARTRQHALSVRSAESRVTAADLVLHDTLVNPDSDAGIALNVSQGAIVEAARLQIRRATDLGVFGTEPGTRITIEDLLIEDVESRPIDGRFGRGIDIELGAALELSRAAIRRVRNLGVFVGDDDASATLSDVHVESVRYEGCADTECPADLVATGIGAYTRARLVAERFSVTDVALCGVQVGPVGEMDLHDGDVTLSEIGACVSVDAYDVSRLTRDVRYGDNETNLVVSGTLPLPVPSPPAD